MSPRARNDLRAGALVALLAFAPGCGDDPAKPSRPVIPPNSSEELIDELAVAYRTRSLSRFTAVLADDPGARYRFVLPEPDPDTGVTLWGPKTELAIHRRLFHPESSPPGESPPPMQWWLQSVDLTFTRRTEFVETARTERWITRRATYRASIFFQLAGDVDYQVNSISDLDVVEDLTKTSGQDGRFRLLRWTERPRSAGPAAELRSIAELKRLYVPPLDGPESEAQLVSALEGTYRQRDAAAFERTLSTAPDAEFRFVRSAPDPISGATSWDLSTERRIHRRMFDPEAVPATDPPVPAEYWLQAIDIAFTPRTAFVERTDLYASPQNPMGFDAEAWRVAEGTYDANVFFQLAGPVDYIVSELERFLVVTARDELPGLPGAATLFQWEDLLEITTANAVLDDPPLVGRSWTQIKSLYK